MARTNAKRRHTSELVRLESVARITSLPIVENGMHIAGTMYDKLKRSNSLMNWSLCTAIATAKFTARPVVYVLNGPITTIDQLLCKGIDIVEQRVPSVHLPPYLMYCNAREYVDKKIVKPVLMRAGSVKHIGSQAANVAADTLDGALTVADKYVDRYLPADPTDKTTDEVQVPAESGKISKTTRTIKHGARLSRKLQKRLTRRTLAEARALKQQGTECIHVLLYVVELLATDPKLAYQKAKELWASLSLPEPENQARPQTLEQLMVLLTRESARRVVHLVNGTTVLAAKAPKNLARVLMKVSHRLVEVVHTTFKVIPVIGKQDVYRGISVLRLSLERLNSTTNQLLEQLAAFLAGRPSVPKAPRVQARRQNQNNHLMGSNSNNPSINGGDVD